MVSAGYVERGLIWAARVGGLRRPTWRYSGGRVRWETGVESLGAAGEGASDALVRRQNGAAFVPTAQRRTKGCLRLCVAICRRISGRELCDSLSAQGE
jgi:hypothetical protein